MNAAARLLNQGTLSRGWVISIIFARFSMQTTLLILAVIASALTLIYVTNSNRTIYANLQQATMEKERLHLQWGQLKLEQSTFLMESRVEMNAKQNLAMDFPEGKSIIVIKGNDESFE